MNRPLASKKIQRLGFVATQSHSTISSWAICHHGTLVVTGRLQKHCPHGPRMLASAIAPDETRLASEQVQQRPRVLPSDLTSQRPASV